MHKEVRVTRCGDVRVFVAGYFSAAVGEKASKKLKKVRGRQSAHGTEVPRGGAPSGGGGSATCSSRA